MVTIGGESIRHARDSRRLCEICIPVSHALDSASAPRARSHVALVGLSLQRVYNQPRSSAMRRASKRLRAEVLAIAADR